MGTPGDATLEMLQSLYAQGIDHCVLLMRHSAREYVPGRHDLLNPLTDEGRQWARRFGESLHKDLSVRAYSSPAERCVETADLVLAGHSEAGGRVTRNRPIEALGVFYMLDQMKAFKAMQQADGQIPFLERWFEGGLAPDIMLPADAAARYVSQVATEKLGSPASERHLDVLVSHDMTVYTLRGQLLGEREAYGPVEYLDGVVFFLRDGKLMVQSHHGAARGLAWS